MHYPISTAMFISEKCGCRTCFRLFVLVCPTFSKKYSSSLRDFLVVVATQPLSLLFSSMIRIVQSVQKYVVKQYNRYSIKSSSICGRCKFFFKIPITKTKGAQLFTSLKSDLSLSSHKQWFCIQLAGSLMEHLIEISALTYIECFKSLAGNSL